MLRGTCSWRRVSRRRVWISVPWTFVSSTIRSALPFAWSRGWVGPLARGLVEWYCSWCPARRRSLKVVVNGVLLLLLRCETDEDVADGFVEAIGPSKSAAVLASTGR